MSNTPQNKTVNVQFTVTLTALGEESFDHVPQVVTYSFPKFTGATIVDETEQSFTSFQNDVVVQWTACLTTSLTAGETVDALRNAVTIGWTGNGCHGDHFESTGIEVELIRPFPDDRSPTVKTLRAFLALCQSGDAPAHHFQLIPADLATASGIPFEETFAHEGVTYAVFITGDVAPWNHEKLEKAGVL